MLDPGGGIAVVYMPVGVDGGEGRGIMATDAGSLAAMPKSVIFQVFVFAEYSTIISFISRGESTVLRFEIPMSEIQIMTLLNPLHDITDDFPGFSFRKMRLLFDISFLYEICQVFLTKFHQNAIFVVLDIHLVPPVEHSDHVWRIRHANSRNNFQLSPIHCPSSIRHNLQRINLQPVSQINPRLLLFDR